MGKGRGGMAGETIAKRKEKLSFWHVMAVVTPVVTCFATTSMVFNTWSVFVVPVCDSLGASTGAFASYSIGLNSSANVTALYYDAAFAQTGVAANLLTDARVAATIGGIAIALGVLTYSKKVMMTVGSNIASISQLDGFIVIIGMALTVVIMGKWMGIPVSTSQAVVGAVIGAGLVKGVDNIHFSILGRIALAWISSPTVAGVLTYLVAVATQNYFLS